MADVDPELAGCTLTLRQQRILVLFRQGLTTREIAHRLRLSARTVRGEITQIFRKVRQSGKSRARIAVQPGHHNSLISAAPPEAAWVKFWSSPRLTAAVVVTLMLVVLLRFLHY
jgi:DNA-binding CsgD family transcriptional regulator